MFFNKRLFRIKRRMHAEHPVVEVKGSIFVLLHELYSLLRHAILDVLIRHVGISIKISKLPRCHVAARRAWPRMMRHIHVKSLLQRRVRFRTEVPFAKMSRGITCIMQRLRQRAVFGLQSRRRIRLHHFLIRRPLLGDRRLKHHLRHMTVGRGDARTRRTQTREKRRSRRRT